MSEIHKVIGQGAYGCIHKSALKCKNEGINDKDMISKVLRKSYGELELLTNAKIDEIDKDCNYHLGISVGCDIKNTQINKDAINKCDKGSSIDYENITNNMLILMKDGGIDLEMFALRIQNYEQNHKNRELMKGFWVEVMRLMLGIELFQNNDFIHHDIKPQNILFNENQMRLNYIDFTLCGSINKFMTHSANGYLLHPGEWWSYPPEHKFIDPFVYESHNNSEQDEPMNQSREIRGFLPYIVFWKDRYINDVRFLYKEKLNDYKELVDKCFKTLDIYGLGFSLLFVLDSGRHLIHPILYHELSQLFYRMITPIYYDRIEIEELLSAYQDVLEVNELI